MNGVHQRLAIRAVRAIQRLGPRKVRVAGSDFVVTRGVFNPRFFVTSELMAVHTDFGTDEDVLDIGTGSGVLAVSAAKSARSVVAIDINPEAVRCAAENARRNKVEVDVRHGDLFEPLASDECFDAILFNPPYLDGVAPDLFGRALHDPGKAIATRFFAGAKGYLRDGGHLWVIYSTIGDTQRMLQIASEHGWVHRVMARKRMLLETFVIYRMAYRR